MVDQAETVFCVVLNDEEQYSVWRWGRSLPAGWRAEGFQGPREDCLKHIESVWTDMRPASLRRDMEIAQRPAWALTAPY
jgi:MbtH protein